MAQLNLSLATLGQLDGGRAKAVINSALNKAIADLEDRGDDGKERVVTIEVIMQKAQEDRRKIEVKAGAKLPPYRTAPTIAMPANLPEGEIGLKFQGENPERPDQPTLPYDDQSQGDR